MCKKSNFGDDRYLEEKLNTSYYNNIYTCTKCDPLYILSYSDYYEKNICKYIYEEEKVQNENNDFNPDNEVIKGCNTKIIKFSQRKIKYNVPNVKINISKFCLDNANYVIKK